LMVVHQNLTNLAGYVIFSMCEKYRTLSKKCMIGTGSMTDPYKGGAISWDIPRQGRDESNFIDNYLKYSA